MVAAAVSVAPAVVEEVMVAVAVPEGVLD